MTTLGFLVSLRLFHSPFAFLKQKLCYLRKILKHLIMEDVNRMQLSPMG